MRLLYYVTLLSCISFLVSCSRAPAPPTQTKQESLEQRVSDLEQYVSDGTAPRVSAEEMRKESEHDLAEIRNLGLAERAQQDFSRRFPRAKIEALSVSYFVD